MPDTTNAERSERYMRYGNALTDAMMGQWIPGSPVERSLAGFEWADDLVRAVMAVADAEIAELRAAVLELAPSDEVLVEGSYFQRADLPRILGNFMRSSGQKGTEAKRAVMRAEAAEAKVERAEALADAYDRIVGDSSAALSIREALGGNS